MRGRATINLYPNVTNWDEEYGSFDKDGNKVTIDESRVDDEVKKLEAEWKAKKYQRDRASAFPSWQDQMDLLYHGGVDALKAELKKTKDKYPKP